jgi:hypothetical protein
MFMTLIAIPLVVPRAVSLLDRALGKAAAFAREKTRLDAAEGDLVLQKIDVPTYVLVEKSGLDDVRHELAQSLQAHPAVQGAQRALEMGLIKRCPKCGQLWPAPAITGTCPECSDA